MMLTHFVYQGTVWPYAAWYACCHVFEREAPGLELRSYNYACKHGIVFG